MKVWTKIGLALSSVLGGAAATAAVGAWRWKRATAQAVACLDGRDAAVDARPFSRGDVEGLPEPVIQYFEFALTPGQPRIRRARVTHAGEFRSGGADGSWRPFTDVQHFAVDPPGFVWDAAIQMAPLLTVRVRDSYIDGVGGMRGKLASLIAVVDHQGTPELAAGALHRYLAEAVWFPTALLPSTRVAWEAIDEHTARATLTDGETSVSLAFHFGARGEIVGAYTAVRYRDVKGAAVPTPWVCHYEDYARVDGMMVPMTGEVEWLLPAGEWPYWRGRIVQADYDFGPP